MLIDKAARIAKAFSEMPKRASLGSRMEVSKKPNVKVSHERVKAAKEAKARKAFEDKASHIVNVIKRTNKINNTQATFLKKNSGLFSAKQKSDIRKALNGNGSNKKHSSSMYNKYDIHGSPSVNARYHNQNGSVNHRIATERNIEGTPVKAADERKSFLFADEHVGKQFDKGKGSVSKVRKAKESSGFGIVENTGKSRAVLPVKVLMKKDNERAIRNAVARKVGIKLGKIASKKHGKDGKKAMRPAFIQTGTTIEATKRQIAQFNKMYMKALEQKDSLLNRSANTKARRAIDRANSEHSDKAELLKKFIKDNR